VADQDRIAKLEEKIKAVMSRPTYASTPAWHQEVVELRVQIEEIRGGKKPVLRPHENPALARLAAGPSPLVMSQAVPAGGAVAAVDAPGAHAHAAHPEPRYMMIFVWLTILTLIELGLSPVFHLKGVVLWLGLATFASLKAIMVAMYYMHLSMESRLMKGLLLLPITLVAILFCLILPDAIRALNLGW
jgi:caa(3)-type oxidase subunit IV